MTINVGLLVAIVSSSVIIVAVFGLLRPVYRHWRNENSFTDEQLRFISRSEIAYLAGRYSMNRAYLHHLLHQRWPRLWLLRVYRHWRVKRQRDCVVSFRRILNRAKQVSCYWTLPTA